MTKIFPAKTTLRPILPSDQHWMREWMTNHWDAEFILVHGERIYPAEFRREKSHWADDLPHLRRFSASTALSRTRELAVRW